MSRTTGCWLIGQCVKIRAKLICHYHRSVHFTRSQDIMVMMRLEMLSGPLSLSSSHLTWHSNTPGEENWRQMVLEIASLLLHYTDTAPVNLGRRLLEKVPFYNCELMPVNVVSLHSRNSVFVLGLFWDVQDIIRYHLPRARYLNISLLSLLLSVFGYLKISLSNHSKAEVSHWLRFI